MDRLKLEANYRTDMSKSRMKEARRQGYVTGSVFGHANEPISVELKLEDLVKQLKAADAGMTSLIDLKVQGAPEKSDGIVMIKEFYKDPVSRKVLDIQFQRVNLKEKINVGVPVVLEGEPEGVREGGMLDQMIDELQLHCLPSDIPPRIEIDVTGLNIGDMVRVADIRLEGNIEITSDPEQIVCSCRAPHVAAGAEAVEAGEAEAAAEGVATPEAATEGEGAAE